MISTLFKYYAFSYFPICLNVIMSRIIMNLFLSFVKGRGGKWQKILIGRIFFDKGWMTDKQIDIVLNELFKLKKESE